MEVSKIKVIIVFVSGRKERLRLSQTTSKEFFYSYHYLKNKVKDVEIVEFNQNLNSQFLHKVLSLSDRFLRKITKLPFFMQEIVSKENFIKFKNSTHLILSNDRIACSIIPIIFILKLIRKSPNITFFALGIFNENSKNIIVKKLKKIFLIILISLVDNVIFLGEGEYKFVKNNFPKQKVKFKFLPFCVDNDFWHINKNKKIEKKGILFVGNDGKRDFKKLIKIADSFPHINFTFVTTMIDQKDIRQKNIELIKGHWNYNIITDKELKMLYSKARITIIPLLDSLQPSGQSVALQSMSVGTPVFISNTKGFWDHSKFINLENIVFVNNNDIKEWKYLINKYYEDEEFLSNISKNALSTVQDFFDINFFNSNLAKIAGIIND